MPYNQLLTSLLVEMGRVADFQPVGVKLGMGHGEDPGQVPTVPLALDASARK